MLFGAFQLTLSLTSSLASRMPILHANAPKLATQLRSTVAALGQAVLQAELAATPGMAARAWRQALAKAQAAQAALQAVEAAQPMLLGGSAASQHLANLVACLEHLAA